MRAYAILPAFTFVAPAGFVNTQRLANMLDSLVRVSRRVGKSVVRPLTDPPRGRTSRELLRRPDALDPGAHTHPKVDVNGTRACVRQSTGRGNEPPRNAPRTLASALLNRRRLPERSFRLPLDGFTHCLTLSSKCFSAFPHGTCSLSDSCQYLALDGIYHPLWAAFPNNPTPHEQPQRQRRGAVQALHPLWVQRSTGLHTAATGRDCSVTPHFPARGTGFGYGLFPLHSPLLGESWLVSFPPLSDMLKFSGSSRLISGAS